MSQNEINSKAKELRELQALIDEAEAEADAIRDEIKAHMTESGTDEIRAGEYRVSWKTVTSSRFDSAAFKAAAPEIYRQYIRESTTRRFCIA